MDLFTDATINYLWSGVGAFLALPGVMFIAWATIPRQRLLSILGAFVGGVLGYFLTIFVWQGPLRGEHLEGAVMLAGTFFIASITGMILALLVVFLFGNSRTPTRSTQVEF